MNLRRLLLPRIRPIISGAPGRRRPRPHVADALDRVQEAEDRAERSVPKVLAHGDRNHFADRIRHTLKGTPGHA